MRFARSRKVYSVWHRWFAWRPVYCAGTGQWAWLETIERKSNNSSLGNIWYYRPAR